MNRLYFCRIKLHTKKNNQILLKILSIDLYCIELEKSVLVIYLRRKMCVGKNFSHSLIEKYGKHTVYTDGVTRYQPKYLLFHI